MCNHPITFSDGHSVPCGQCMACRVNYARNWAIRIMAEAKGKACSFVTLTYDEEHLPDNHSLVKRDLTLFFKRLRKSGYKFRYYAVGEYGDKYHRPHYHIAFFDLPVGASCFENAHFDEKRKVWRCTMREWPNGLVAVGTLTADSANYVAGYMQKKLKGKAKSFYDEQGIIPEYSVCSRRPGIGYDYIQTNIKWLRENRFLVFKGHKYPLTRYFLEHCFSEEERLEKRAVESLENSRRKFDEEIAVINRLGEYGYDYLEERKKQRENNLKARLGQKGRSFENAD